MSTAPYLPTELTVSDGDLMAIGAALLNIVVTVQQLGHASPGSTLDYMSGLDLLDGEESAAGHILRDFIAWTSGRKRLSPGCDDRLKNFTRQSGWYRHCLDAAFADFADLLPTKPENSPTERAS